MAYIYQPKQRLTVAKKTLRWLCLTSFPSLHIGFWGHFTWWKALFLPVQYAGSIPLATVYIPTKANNMCRRWTATALYYTKCIRDDTLLADASSTLLPVYKVWWCFYTLTCSLPAANRLSVGWAAATQNLSCSLLKVWTPVLKDLKN